MEKKRVPLVKPARTGGAEVILYELEAHEATTGCAGAGAGSLLLLAGILIPGIGIATIVAFGIASITTFSAMALVCSN